ncbi:hypothetical protein MTO96_020708 [Rhipicephalus appendiculatus]
MSRGCPVPALQLPASRFLAGQGDPASRLSRGSFPPDVRRLQALSRSAPDVAPGPGSSVKSGDTSFLEELNQPLATGVAGAVFAHAPGFTAKAANR